MMPPSRPGQTLTAGLINEIKRMLLSVIVGGRGIAVRNLSGRVVIECLAPDVRGRRGGSIDEVTAEDRAGLESAIAAMEAQGRDMEGAFARTTGAIKRTYRYLAEELICYTHGESS